jgi:hypothetical protein
MNAEFLPQVRRSTERWKIASFSYSIVRNKYQRQSEKMLAKQCAVEA